MRVEAFERLMPGLRAAFTSQGCDGILKARAVEDQLMRNTWQAPGYDRLPKLRSLRVPTLVTAGEQDFIPVKLADDIAKAIPGARLVTVKEYGHFAYRECAGDERKTLDGFIPRAR